MHHRSHGGGASSYGEWGSHLMSAIVSCLGVTQTECGCSSNSLCVSTPCKIAIYNSNSIPCMAVVAILDTASVTFVNYHHNFRSSLSKHKLYQCLIYSVNTVPSVSVAKPLLYFSVSISYSKLFASQLIRILT